MSAKTPRQECRENEVAFVKEMARPFFSSIVHRVDGVDPQRIVDEMTVTDMLTALMHFCAEHGEDFGEAVERAARHFEYETSDQYDVENQ